MTCRYAYMVIVCLLYGHSGVGICTSSSDEHSLLFDQDLKAGIGRLLQNIV